MTEDFSWDFFVVSWDLYLPLLVEKPLEKIVHHIFLEWLHYNELSNMDDFEFNSFKSKVN